jgi:hypothetical protein
MKVHLEIGYNLPNPSFITEPAKTAGMISISSEALLGRMISTACEKREPEHP